MYKAFRLCSNPIFDEPEVNLNSDAELVRTAALFMAEEHLEKGRGVCILRAWHYDYDNQCWKKQLLL